MRLFSLSLALLFLLLSPAALAQKKGEDDPALAEAKERFTKAETHFRLREFESAIVELKEAYRLYPNALFLYNIAQCYRELKQYEEALSYYENYLEKSPKAKNRKEVEEYIKQVKAAIAEEEERRRKEEEARLEAEKLKLMSQTLPTSNGTTKGPAIFGRWWFWAGLAGAVASTGVVVTVVSNAPPRTDLGNIDILDQ